MSSKHSKPIFREYIIGSKDPAIDGFPVDIINGEIPQFHFILAFASEDYEEDRRGKGIFRPKWNVTNFSAKSISKLKETYVNAKVVISVGGTGTDCPFNPLYPDKWVDMATDSLTKIITETYKDHCGQTVIDGIDINYEYIESKENDFVDCIGNLISRLKTIIGGLGVSISPSHPFLSPYQKLFLANKHKVDWVNYQYYKQEVPNTDEFVNLHNILTDTFHDKLLAGFSTDPKDEGNISLEVFVKGCKKLIASDSLSGIFISDAQSSQFSEPPLYVEKKAQEILLNPIWSPDHDTTVP